MENDEEMECGREVEETDMRRASKKGEVGSSPKGAKGVKPVQTTKSWHQSSGRPEKVEMSRYIIT